MAIFFNNGTGPKQPKEVWFNPGTGPKSAKEVWFNPGTGPKRVWPMDQIAYNGTLFSGIMSNGVKTGFNFYSFRYNRRKTQYIGTNYFIQNSNTTSNNLTIVKGSLPLNYDLGLDSSDLNTIVYIGYVSNNLIDFSPYTKLIIGIKGANEYDYTNALPQALNVCFIKATQNDGYYIRHLTNNSTTNKNNPNLTATFSTTSNNDTGEYIINVSDLKESYYIVFEAEISFNSSRDNHYKYWKNGAFTKIEFKTT